MWAVNQCMENLFPTLCYSAIQVNKITTQKGKNISEETYKFSFKTKNRFESEESEEDFEPWHHLLFSLFLLILIVSKAVRQRKMSTEGYSHCWFMWNWNDACSG